MSKKPDTAAALAGILNAKRGGDRPSPAITLHEEPPPQAHPSPALPPVFPRVETPVSQSRGGKSSDPNYSQFSVYLRKSLRKKVGRALDDADNGQDFSELVQELLEQWLAART